MKTEMRDKLAESLLLYAVTDRHWLGERTLYDVVRESLDGGVTFLQLREKDLDDENFYEEAVRLQEMARSYGVPFVVNDNVDIAVRMDADGVHVGQSDMEAGDVRALSLRKSAALTISASEPCSLQAPRTMLMMYPSKHSRLSARLSRSRS